MCASFNRMICRPEIHVGGIPDIMTKFRAFPYKTQANQCAREGTDAVTPNVSDYLEIGGGQHKTSRTYIVALVSRCISALLYMHWAIVKVRFERQSIEKGHKNRVG